LSRVRPWPAPWPPAGLGRRGRGLCLLPEAADATAAAELGYEILRGGHPVPTGRGLAASRRILAQVSALGREQRLLYLVSGGTSALLEVPREGLASGALIDAYRVLLLCGAPIEELNLLRRALSAVKGGGLARAAAPAEVDTLAVSDVVGDDPLVIGSGPTVAGEVDVRELAHLVARYDLHRIVAPEVLALLATAPPACPANPRSSYEIVASNRVACDAARASLADLAALVVAGAGLVGDAEAAARSLAAGLRTLAAEGASGALVLGGETTVRVSGSCGAGGRNQQLALRLALELEGVADVTVLVAGTDGIDGSSEAAGAIVDGTTAARIRAAGLEPEAALAAFDSSPALAAAGDRLVTGPTSTNVGDLLVALLGRASASGSW
jgi:glycerate 2-kinase